MRIITDKRVEKRYDNIIKSQNDHRLYRGLLLANKMKVLLVSDPTTDISAAAMDINIGHLCDPDDLPGLTHFCEHMLIKGTEKYPQHNAYTTYVAENGGRTDAITNIDHTTYLFDITAEKLEDALDYFAQFFIAPLFTETMIEHEINAINSEYEATLADDTMRIIQLNKSSAYPAHPFSRFYIGTKETLDIIPKQKGINIRNRLLEFYEKYYSANIMSLSVLGKENLNELENMVVNLFSEVRNKEIESPVWSEPPFKNEQFRTIWYIVPIKNIRKLDLLFPLSDLQQHYQSRPAHYVSHLLGHKGEGSLLSALKARNWCNSVEPKHNHGARGFSFFSILFDLTKEGIKHVKDIVQLTFQYINMLKLNGAVEWIYNEYKYIADINFRFMEKNKPISYMQSMAYALQKYPINKVLSAEHVFTEWQPDLIIEIMNYLTPKNIRIHCIAKVHKDIADETEKWYNIDYKKGEISEETIDMWNNAGYNSELKLPSKNDFIATKFDIKANIEQFPIILEDNEYIKLWYKKDNEFLVPKAKMIFNFISPLAYMHPVNYNLTHMFIQVFCDSLSEYTYDAELAGIQWKLDNSKYAMTLIISGYDNMQGILLENIIDRMINFKVDPKRFEILKENYISNLINFDAKEPYEQAQYYLGTLLTEQAWLENELLESITYLTVERLQWFIPQLFNKIHIECLIHGNVTKLEAIDTVKLISSKLKTKSYSIPLLYSILYRGIKLEDGYHFLFEIESKLQKNSCTMIYYQTGLQSTESNMLLELLLQIIAEPFNTLRIKKNLGYILYSNIYRTNGTQGLQIVVQGDKHPQYVEKEINSFIDFMLDHITAMPEEQFEKFKKAVATLCLEKPEEINARCTLYWKEISSQQYNFDRANIEVSYLKTITRQQLLDFFKEKIQSKAQPKLSIHVISTMTSTEKNSVYTEKITDLSIDEKIKKINDIMSFKNSQSLYPILKPFKEYSKKMIF